MKPVGALDATWTSSDQPEDGPLPLSQRYRDKLDELEAKVGPEKFKELTGRVAPSQSKSGKATSSSNRQGGGGLGVSSLLAMCAHNPKKVAVTAAVVVGVTVVAFRLHLYMKATGGRIPGYGGALAYASVSPPPRRAIEAWLRELESNALAEIEESAEAAATEIKKDASAPTPAADYTIVLGRGGNCLRAALSVLREARLLEGDAHAELTVLNPSSSSSSTATSGRSSSANSKNSDSSSKGSGADLLAGLLLQPGSSKEGGSGSSGSGLWWVLPLVVDRSALPSPSSQVAIEALETAAAGGAGVVGATPSSPSPSVVVGELTLRPLDRRACPPWFRSPAGDSRSSGSGSGATASNAMRLRVSVDGAGAVTLDVYLDPVLKKSAADTLSSSSSLKQHAVCAAIAQGTARVVKQEMRVLTARERQQSNYQGEADREYAAKLARERAERLKRGDTRAHHRFGTTAQPGSNLRGGYLARPLSWKRQ